MAESADAPNAGEGADPSNEIRQQNPGESIRRIWSASRPRPASGRHRPGARPVSARSEPETAIRAINMTAGASRHGARSGKGMPSVLRVTSMAAAPVRAAPDNGIEARLPVTGAAAAGPTPCSTINRG